MNLDPEPLTRPVYSAAAVRELDRIAIEDYGIAGFTLMTRAARAALDVLTRRWPGTQTLEVFCGAGNNAGDGYVLARLAREAGLEVRVHAMVAGERLRGDARRAFDECVAAGVRPRSWAEGGPARPHGAGSAAPRQNAGAVVIDALLGTGLARRVSGDWAEAIEHLNTCSAPVLALDVPSGLDATTGVVHGVAVRADVTVTFVGLKQGLYIGEGPDHCGVLEFAGLGIPADAAARLRPTLAALEPALLRARLPRRARSAHKGRHGRVLLVGGGEGMPGAIRLAAEGALRVGAGLVHVATHRDSVLPVLAGRPELMCRAVGAPADLEPWLEAADVVVLGPGLGRSDWARALAARVLDHDVPLVLDADGLNLLAEAPRPRANWVLTPHPGEAARLAGCETAAVQSDRPGVARRLADHYGAVVVLKGACTLIACPTAAKVTATTTAQGEEGRAGVERRDARDAPLTVCPYGNPGMASGGTGDVLAGVIGGLAAQLGDLGDAARTGVLLHALAGDLAAERGERGMLASDLITELRRWANPS